MKSPSSDKLPKIVRPPEDEQLDLFEAFDAERRELLTKLFPEFERKVTEVLQGHEASSAIPIAQAREVGILFREISSESTEPPHRIISRFTNRQVAGTLTYLLSDINLITLNEVEVALEYLQPPSLDMNAVLQQIEKKLTEQKKECVRYALKFGILPAHAAYYDTAGWIGLLQEPEYRKNLEAALNLLRQTTGRFLDQAKPESAEHMIVSDLGPGTGELALEQIDAEFKYYEEYDVKFQHLFVDESPGMLLIAITHLLDKYTQYLLNLTRRPQAQAQMRKWLEPLIDALRIINRQRGEEAKLKFSENIAFLTIKLKDLFEKFIRRNSKYIEKDEVDIDEEIIDIDLHLDSELMSAGALKERAEKTGELIKFFVARMLSMHKRDHAADLIKIDKARIPCTLEPIQTTFDRLDFSEIKANSKVGVMHCIYGNTPNNEDPLQFLEEVVKKKLLTPPEVDDNGNVTCANYCVLGVQIREGATTAVSKGQGRLLKPYDTEPSRNFVGSLFLDPEITSYHNPRSFEEEKISDVIEIKFGLEPDPHNEKLKVMQPRLVFKKDTIVSTGSTHDAMFKAKGKSIKLLPVYKPTMWQYKEFCNSLGIQIVDEEKDITYGTDVVHFLVRLMTPAEKEEYQAILQRRARNQARRVRDSQKLPQPSTEDDVPEDALKRASVKNRKARLSKRKKTAPKRTRRPRKAS